MPKIRMSVLSHKSEKQLLEALSLEDLRDMAYLSSDVIKGSATIETFRAKEQEMIKKYGFVMKS